MKHAIPFLLACLIIPCWGDEADSPEPGEANESPTFEKRESQVTLLKENPDGTFLVLLKPEVYLDELGCVMVSDGDGNVFSMIHFIIAFSLDEVRYWTIWGTSPGGGAPVKLDSKKQYKCLFKSLAPEQDDEDRCCVILKIWEGEELVYQRKNASEPGGARRAATAPESNPQGRENPGPESEAR